VPEQTPGEPKQVKEGERIVNGHRFDRSGVPVNYTHTGDKVPLTFDRERHAVDFLKKMPKARRNELEVVQGPSGRWWIVRKIGKAAEAVPKTAGARRQDPPERLHGASASPEVTGEVG